jgi:glycosyltransferase involved in cell wall biosynthesis
LKELVQRYGLSDRVHLDVGFHPREKIASWVSNALACAYLPIDEDSLGYVSMEANQAAKGVLTVTDSGGILDLVFHNETGWVCEPDAIQLAEQLDRIHEKRAETIAMGKNAKNRWLSMGINWAKTIERLVA